MLVRRILRHWKTQNWLGVGLDLLVVIAGILIGLRIDAWRDEVQNREDETEYLARLLEDAEANHGALKEVLERMWYRRDQGRKALERLLSGEALTPEERKRTVDALVQSGDLPRPAVLTGTYDELISTGRMPIIRDQELRGLLQRQMATHEQVAARADALRSALLGAQPFSDQHAILAGEANGEGIALGKSYDLEGLRSDNRALVAFFNQIELSEDFSVEREAEMLAVRNVREHLRCLLDRPECEGRKGGLQQLTEDKAGEGGAER
ncbi:hypothetical protein HK107_03915 [Parvularcula sp. ZS-1/3]|uniref:Uncharacterized protein n=1 Tax=Parvularcula mediterranea TaxID=2732508 RepID=A0A7Y3RK20_9PROT|nr:hypothetical protein [Parvularcula mediterranea]NNU15466.1 hypothetical protein [Parvularcula mediterranea]